MPLEALAMSLEAPAMSLEAPAFQQREALAVHQLVVETQLHLEVDLSDKVRVGKLVVGVA